MIEHPSMKKGSAAPPRTNSNSSSSKNKPASPHQKLKLICTFGGVFVPRQPTGELRYVGGESRIISFDRRGFGLLALVSKASELLRPNLRPFSLKYQQQHLLASIQTEADVMRMIEEHDRIVARGNLNHRLRVFLLYEATLTAAAAGGGRANPISATCLSSQLSGNSDPVAQKNWTFKGGIAVSDRNLLAVRTRYHVTQVENSSDESNKKKAFIRTHHAEMFQFIDDPYCKCKGNALEDHCNGNSGNGYRGSCVCGVGRATEPPLRKTKSAAVGNLLRRGNAIPWNVHHTSLMETCLSIQPSRRALQPKLFPGTGLSAIPQSKTRSHRSALRSRSIFSKLGQGRSNSTHTAKTMDVGSTKEVICTLPRPPFNQPSVVSNTMKDLVCDGMNKRTGPSTLVREKERNTVASTMICSTIEAETSSSLHPLYSHLTSQRLQTIKDSDLEEIRELGSGSYGTVFYGKWKGSDVAIKRLKPSCFAGGELVKARLVADFWKEAQLLGHLHHPNVVAFYGVVIDGPVSSLATVTEYMVNGSLKQVLKRKDRTIDHRKRLIIAMDAAFGMEYLHEKNVVHFDLKSHNFLVNMRDPQRSVCKIGDLGLSKVKQRTLVSGGVRGTLPWMAPELLINESNMVTEKVDVYSFGIVMWELLTGEEPYENMCSKEIVVGIIKGHLRPLIPSWCDPAWRSLMERCWSSDPSSRPPFSEIAKELRGIAVSLNMKY